MSIPRISLLVPTRGRPHGLGAMITSAVQLAAEPSALETVLYTDEDSPVPLDHMRGLSLIPFGARVTVVSGPRIVLSQMWNECYGQAGGELLMHAADDIRFRTQGWDKYVREAFETYPDRIVLVHGNDLHQGPALGTHSWLHRRWVEALGYFVPPYFSCDYNDTWLNDVADRIGRRTYLPNVITEHLHPDAGKGSWDQTHMDRVTRGRADNVGDLYASLENERERDAAKLQAVIDGRVP